jgi:hypothetical protein
MWKNSVNKLFIKSQFICVFTLLLFWRVFHLIFIYLQLWQQIWTPIMDYLHQYCHNWCEGRARTGRQGLRRGFCRIGDGIKLFTVNNCFQFVYQKYNYKHKFGPIARYYINWPQEIDTPSEPSEGTTFFTIRFSLRGALTKRMLTSTEPQFSHRRVQNCWWFSETQRTRN